MRLRLAVGGRENAAPSGFYTNQGVITRKDLLDYHSIILMVTDNKRSNQNQNVQVMRLAGKVTVKRNGQVRQGPERP